MVAGRGGFPARIATEREADMDGPQQQSRNCDASRAPGAEFLDAVETTELQWVLTTLREFG